MRVLTMDHRSSPLGDPWRYAFNFYVLQLSTWAREMMRRTRELAKSYLHFDLAVTIWSHVILAIVAAILLVLALIRGNHDTLMPLIITVVVTVMYLGFIFWVFRDARESCEHLRSKSKKAETLEPPPDGDISDIAGIPRRPPWMG